MELKKILTKKAAVEAGSALVTAATTGLVYFLSKNARMEVIEEVVNEESEKQKDIIDVDFKEEESNTESETGKVEEEKQTEDLEEDNDNETEQN